MQNVTLRRQVNGGAWSIVRQEEDVYYDGVEAHGYAGDLKTATLKDGAGTVLYAVSIWVKGDGLGYTCSCPAGSEGDFCKHCVAVAVAWLEPRPTEPGP